MKPKKNTAEYWQTRMESVLIDNEKLALDYEKELALIYEQRIIEIQQELESFYNRYATKNGLTMSEVKKRLNGTQLKRFKIQQEKYLKAVNDLIDKGADLTAYANKLELLSGRAYVSKLQEIQNNLNSQIMILTGEQQVKMTSLMSAVYLEGYFKTIFELQKGVGMGMSFTQPANDDVLKILKTNWNGHNYSSAIWSNKQALTNWLNTDLARHFARGSSVPDMSKDLAGKLNSNYKNAVRLVRTETNYISNQSTMDAYKQTNVEQYQILATLDSRTSEICREMDGKVFKLSEKEVAVTMPPFHPNCRTTTIPYFDDEDYEGLERIARDENNNTYYVPANMTYKQWNLKYVK